MRPFAGLVLFFIFLVSGCATALPVADVTAAWQARQAALAPVTAWTLRGRLALRAAGQGGHATLRWERDGERHRLDFTGPLGRGHLRLVRDAQGAELRDAEQRATGWTVPLEGMNYWVLGLPAPDPAPAPRLDAQGRLERLTQSGWDIRFLEYTRHGAYELPSRLYITAKNHRPRGDAAETETLEVRLSIEQWTIP